VFGPENIIARRYISKAPPEFLYQDFLAAVGADTLDFSPLYKPPRLNQTPTYRAVLEALRSNACQHGRPAVTLPALLRELFGHADTRLLDHRFDALQRDEQEALIERFSDSNRTLVHQYGVSLVSRWSSFDKAAQKRRQVLDAAMQRWR